MSPYSYSGYDVTASLVSSRKLALGLQNVEDDTLSSEGDAWDTEGWDNDLLVRSRVACVVCVVRRVCRVSCVSWLTWAGHGSRSSRMTTMTRAGEPRSRVSPPGRSRRHPAARTATASAVAATGRASRRRGGR